MLTRYPAVPYTVPFGVLIALLGLNYVLPASIPVLADQATRVAIMVLVLWLVARPVLDFRVRHWAGTIAAGLLISILWIAPDLAFPAYRHSLLFENPLMGVARSSLPEAARHNPLVLALRTFRAAAIVPVAEELFWRGWLMRRTIAADFVRVPLGSYAAASFWPVALLFASEHGPYWDVGLVAGVIFNAWMIRTKSLGDLILTHAVANGCLSAYVIAAGRWEYWL